MAKRPMTSETLEWLNAGGVSVDDLMSRTQSRIVHWCLAAGALSVPFALGLAMLLGPHVLGEELIWLAPHGIANAIGWWWVGRRPEHAVPVFLAIFLPTIAAGGWALGAHGGLDNPFAVLLLNVTAIPLPLLIRLRDRMALTIGVVGLFFAAVALGGSPLPVADAVPLIISALLLGSAMITIGAALTWLVQRNSEHQVELAESAATQAALADALAGRSERLGHELRDLAGRMARVQEDERARLARDLHTDLGRSIAALGAMLSVSDRGGEAGEQTSQLSRELLTDLRGLVHNLRADPLEDRSLADAITEAAQEAGRWWGFEVKLTLDDADPPVEHDQAAARLAVYRIVQEALTNTGRHAEAHLVTIRAGVRGGQWVLEISDDGKGLPDGVADGIGLKGIRERAASFGAHVRIARAPKGTVVRLSKQAGARPTLD